MSPRKVVLFFPKYATEEVAPPLALTSIAGPLVGDGVEVVIVDSSIEPDFVDRVVEACDGAVCLGVSVITGPMIRDTVAVCRAVKARYPALPVVLGGWHPSILPEQTAAASFVDAVVLRQGEVTFRELVATLAEGGDLAEVPGLVYRRGGEILRSEPRPYTGVAHLPDRMPGYGLVDYDAYERRTGLRWTMYSTSHGCPYNCSYCSNASVYGRKLDTLPAEQVVQEVAFLVERYGIRLLGIIDDIFFAYQDRSLAIAEGFLRRGLKMQWYIQDRADSIARLSPDQARMLGRSGLVRVHFGAESGSDDVLRAIEKRSKVAAMLDAVDRCRDGDFRASFGFIFGLPDETEADMRLTVELIADIYQRWDRADCYTNIFTPYPGSPLWPRCIELGLQAPQSFEEWADFFPRLQVLPWLQGEAHQRLQDIRQYLRFAYPNVRVGEAPASLRHRVALGLLGPPARWRIARHKYGLPVEIRAYAAAQRMKPSLRIYDRY